MPLEKAVYELEWWSFGTYMETPDGWFVPDPSAPYLPRRYEPAREPGLVSAVTHLHATSYSDEHSQDILHFLRDFGCLGQTTFSKQYREVDDRFVDGDSRLWLEHHGRAVNLIMRLHEAQENGDKGRLHELLAELHDSQKRLRTTFLAAGERCMSVELPLQFYKSEPAATAQRVVEAILNLNLGGVDRAVHQGRDVFKFKTLVQLVYWRLRDELMEARPVRRCMGCGQTFFVYDARQRFCPPPPFAKESRCAVKLRVSRYRSKAELADSTEN